MKKTFIIEYGGQVHWNYRNTIEVICTDEEIDGVAHAILLGHIGIGNMGFCVITDKESGRNWCIADCM